MLGKYDGLYMYVDCISITGFRFYMYVDCDSGTVGFGTEVEYYGAPISVPKAKYPIFPMVGCLCQNAQITMIYRGSGMFSLGIICILT